MPAGLVASRHIDHTTGPSGISVDPVDHCVARWIDALPQYGPAHAELAAEVRAGLPQGLAVAGAYLDGIGVPACVAAATRAAAELVVDRR